MDGACSVILVGLKCLLAALFVDHDGHDCQNVVLLKAASAKHPSLPKTRSVRRCLFVWVVVGGATRLLDQFKYRVRNNRTRSTFTYLRNCRFMGRWT